MSWSKTPAKGEVTKRQKYVVPQIRNKWGRVEYAMTPEIEREFIRLYPTTMNRDLMGLFGLSFSTLQRFKRELGLKKNDKVIKHKHAAMIKRICEKNGYYDSLRGKQPTPQCLEASRQWWADGNHPKKVLKEKNPAKYRAVLRKQSKQRKEQFAKERVRLNIGLEQKTALHIPQFAYTRQQVSARFNALKRGYILGDKRERFGERYTIYWDEGTSRSSLFERNLDKYGFYIKELPVAG